jgi:lipid-binding SYLF domain-containing protein
LASSTAKARCAWVARRPAITARLAGGANGNIDTSTATAVLFAWNTQTAPVQAFVLTNAGLMAGISLEGTKVPRLKI